MVIIQNNWGRNCRLGSDIGHNWSTYQTKQETRSSWYFCGRNTQWLIARQGELNAHTAEIELPHRQGKPLATAFQSQAWLTTRCVWTSTGSAVSWHVETMSIMAHGCCWLPWCVIHSGLCDHRRDHGTIKMKVVGALLLSAILNRVWNHGESQWAGRNKLSLGSTIDWIVTLAYEVSCNQL